jgi:hypothetical protein
VKTILAGLGQSAGFQKLLLPSVLSCIDGFGAFYAAAEQSMIVGHLLDEGLFERVGRLQGVDKGLQELLVVLGIVEAGDRRGSQIGNGLLNPLSRMTDPTKILDQPRGPKEVYVIDCKAVNGIFKTQTDAEHFFRKTGKR